MKLTSTLLFLLLFAGVLIFYWFTRPEKTSSDADRAAFVETKTKKVLALAPEDGIVWLQIQNLNKKETITLVQEDNNWRMKYPLNYDADDEVVEKMVRALLYAERDKIYQPEKDWEEYGLLRPEYKIGLMFSKTPRRRYLYLGDKAPLEQGIFARWEHEDGYFLTSPDLKEYFEVSLYTLREKKIFRGRASEAEKIAFQIGSNLYEMKKIENLWVWVFPETLRREVIEAKEMNALLQQVMNLFIKDFVRIDTLSGEDPGISKDADFIEVTFEERGPEKLFLGREYPRRDAYFAKRSNEAILLYLDRNKVRNVLETVDLLTHREKAAVFL